MWRKNSNETFFGDFCSLWKCQIIWLLKIIKLWNFEKFLSPWSYLSFISAFPHFECKIMWVERCETKPSSSVFFCKSIISIDRKEERLFLHFVHPFFQQTFLFNFFWGHKRFSSPKEKMMGKAESQKALFIVVTTTAGKEIF